jgi:Uma2 family endonuclease
MKGLCDHVLMDGVHREHLAHAPPSAPSRLHYTRARFMEMDELGLFRDQRVELIEGDIYVVAPMGEDHAVPIERLNLLLVRALPEEFSLRCQLPIAAADDSQPQPDFTILPAKRRGPAQTPAQATLVIEVADSSLEFDLKRKSAVYARAAVPEYWVLDVKRKVLVVHRSPSGARYRSVKRLSDLAHVASTAVPGLALDLRNVFVK